MNHLENQSSLILSEGLLRTYETAINKLVSQNQEKVSQTIESLDFNSFIQFLRQSYYLYDEKNIPKGVVLLLNNMSFKEKVNSLIQSSFLKILHSDGINSFEYISFFLFLLGFGKYNGVLENFNHYNEEKLSNLFDSHIYAIINSDAKDLDTNFSAFINLSDLLTVLCILNQVDSSRKILIPSLVGIIEEKSAILIEKMQQRGIINTNRLNKLTFAGSKLGVNFLYLTHVETKGESLERIIEKFGVLIFDTINSFENAKSSNFGGNPEKYFSMYRVYLGNLATLGTRFIYELSKRFSFLEVKVKTSFKEIISKLLEQAGLEIDIFKSFDYRDIANVMTKIYSGIYFSSLENVQVNSEGLIDNIQKKSSSYVVDDFIENGGKNIDNTNALEALYYIVINTELSKEQLLMVGTSLLETKGASNFAFEFIKLKLLDTIVMKFKKGDGDIAVLNFLEKFILYIEENKTASQLLHTYLRSYLTVAYYYSFCRDTKCIDNAVKYYVLFKKINGDDFEYEKYDIDLNRLKYNIGLYRLSIGFCEGSSQHLTRVCGAEKGVDCIPAHQSKCGFNEDTNSYVIAFGEREISLALAEYGVEYEKRVGNILYNLLSEVVSTEINGEEELKLFLVKAGNTISNEIFHGISGVSVMSGNTVDKVENGMLQSSVGIDRGYKILFTYPKICSEVFLKILNEWQEYIVRVINNELGNFYVEKDKNIDKVTGLPNDNKLKAILSAKEELGEQPNMIFINIKTLENVNNKHNRAIGDEYLKKIISELSLISGVAGNLYRLIGTSKLVILLPENIDLNYILEKLQLMTIIKFDYSNGEYQFNLAVNIGVISGDSKGLFDKGLRALEFSKKSSNGLGHYNDYVSQEDSSRDDLELLGELDKAIEEGRIVVFFQPIVCAVTGNPLKYEALFRIKKTDGNGKNYYESPYKYLLIAEKYGRMEKISKIVIEKAFREADKYKINPTINITSNDFLNKSIEKVILDCVRKYNVPPERVTFEVLEGEWEKGGNDYIDAVRHYKRIGFKIAMDDFGAKHSNLDRLLDLLQPKGIDGNTDGVIKELTGLSSIDNISFANGILDTIKIDGKIIQALSGIDKKGNKIIDDLRKELFENNGVVNLEKVELYITEALSSNDAANDTSIIGAVISGFMDAIEDKDIALLENKLNLLQKLISYKATQLANVATEIVRGIIGAAHSAKVKVLAEYVDNIELFKLCKELGFDEIQGYYFSQPMLLKDFLRYNNNKGKIKK